MTELARETTTAGTELVLHRRAGIYSLRLDGLELMSSRAHGSESALAQLACKGLENRDGARVLLGGLGFGYTLRAALDRLGARARVVVCEVFRSLLEWNRTWLTDLAGRPLDDPRVEVRLNDVWNALDRAQAFDAILLDVDNGPWAFTLESNKRLYRDEGLARLARSLTQNGRLAVWSADPSPEFERRLSQAGLAVDTEQVPAYPGARVLHTLFVAAKE